MTISTRINPNRRSVAIGLGLSLALGPLAYPVQAATESGAKDQVVKLVAAINKVIASGKSESNMIRDFEKIFVKYSDVPYLASYALGVDGRKASAGQKRAFTKAFQGYIARKYGKRFREFIGGRLEVKSAKTVKRHIEVRTFAHLTGQAPFEIMFHMSDRSGKLLFFNMYIEGINMLLTERTEIGAMLDKRKGNLDQMIKDLKTAG